jgi:ASC-1-like (ASCH) protein
MKLISETHLKTYKNHRQEPYYTFLKNGLKTIEGRLDKGLYAEVAPGDHILVHTSTEDEHVEVEVVAVRSYTDFQAMLSTESIAKVLPNIHLVEDGVKLYRQFYSEAQEQEYGVNAIEVRLV